MGSYQSEGEETINVKTVDIGVSYKIGVQDLTKSRESEKWKIFYWFETVLDLATHTILSVH
jgi:hypothetical protein